MGIAPLSAPAQDGGAAAAARVNDFGFDLLRAVGSKSNACASPTSIALALAMARAGAGGQTAVEMDAVLHDLGRTGQASEIAALIKSLRSVAVHHEQLPGEAPDPTLHDQDPVLSIATRRSCRRECGSNPPTWTSWAPVSARASDSGLPIGFRRRQEVDQWLDRRANQRPNSTDPSAGGRRWIDAFRAGQRHLSQGRMAGPVRPGEPRSRSHSPRRRAPRSRCRPWQAASCGATPWGPDIGRSTFRTSGPTCP